MKKKTSRLGERDKQKEREQAAAAKLLLIIITTNQEEYLIKPSKYVM